MNDCLLLKNGFEAGLAHTPPRLIHLLVLTYTPYTCDLDAGGASSLTAG